MALRGMCAVVEVNVKVETSGGAWHGGGMAWRWHGAVYSVHFCGGALCSVSG